MYEYSFRLNKIHSHEHAFLITGLFESGLWGLLQWVMTVLRIEG